MGLFITYEGGEGSGKSTHARSLYRKLARLELPVLLTHEPGVTPLGKRMGRLLKWARKMEISPLAELLMFNVSRIQLISEVIRPALDSDKIVICDRFAASTVAYQGYGRGLDLKQVKVVNEIGTGGLRPDLTVLLDITAEAGLRRKGGKTADRFEAEDIAFHTRVRAGYLKQAEEEPRRWLVVDAEKSKKEIAGIVWDRVRKMIPGEKINRLSEGLDVR